MCADVFVHALLARSVSFMGLVSLRWLLLSSNLLNCNLRLGPLQRPLYASCLPCSCSLDALKNTCFAHLQRKLCFCISKKQMLMSKCLWFFKLQIIGSSKPRNWLFHDQMSVSGFVQCFITFSSHVQQEVSLPLQLEDLVVPVVYLGEINNRSFSGFLAAPAFRYFLSLVACSHVV